MPVFLLPEDSVFPPAHLAREDGLLAVGGDLTTERLLAAYRMGIFPWYQDDEPILWWSPDPRLVLYPDRLHVSRSLGRLLRKQRFTVSLDTAFEAVISACARTRVENHTGTWIVDDMITAYSRLHRIGYAHSVEVWDGDELAGGLYGVAIGGSFFGESMFSAQSNASKVAFVALIRQLAAWNFDMVDCQVTTSHMIRFGACEIPRFRFLNELQASLQKKTRKGLWEFDSNIELF